MALLERVLQREPRRPHAVDDMQMTIIEHLEDLRRVLIIAIIGWAAGSLIGLVFSNNILEFLIQRAHLTQGLIFLGPAGGFGIRLKIGLYVGIIIGSPIIIQQLWWFVSPGLHVHERKLVGPLIMATILFFLIGVGFALFALPLILHVLLSLAPPDVRPMITADEFVGFLLTLVIGFGLVFELPVILFVLGMLRIISSRWLYKNRGYWLIALALLANLMTPGADPLTPAIMFVPLYIFWEATALLLKLTGR